VGKQTILPARSISGAVAVPGDKSISHRYAILAALAEGTSEIRNFSAAEDCARTLGCLERLGVRVQRHTDRISITGAGLGGLKPPRPGFGRAKAAPLDAGNSGTTMRLLAGVLAGQPFEASLDGDRSLRRRPMRRVIEPLTLMGAQIRARDGEFAPLEIRGSSLRPVDYTLPVASAQVKSAILLAGLFAEGVTAVHEPVRTRDHLELALAEFGATIERPDRTVRVHGRPRLAPAQLAVPGDLSSAVFFLGAALLLPESNLLISGVGLNPTRTAVLDVLASWGAPVSLVNLQMRHGELAGDIAVRHAVLEGGVISGATVPAVIDELPLLAALGPFTEQGVEIRDARELRAKESDRIAVLAENLRRMGARVEEFPDGLRVEGKTSLRGAAIDPQGDHRMAMAFAVAGLRAAGKTVIQNAECAAVSFPGFYEWLERLAEK
jgi:3-phosphoshikimate 1-carboxyvinyltransferase